MELVKEDLIKEDLIKEIEEEQTALEEEAFKLYCKDQYEKLVNSVKYSRERVGVNEKKLDETTIASLRDSFFFHVKDEYIQRVQAKKNLPA